MLFLRLDRSWFGRMMCLLALIIGTSSFVPTAQAFQEEEPVAEVEEASAETEDVTAVEESELENTQEMEEGAAADTPEPDEHYAINTIVMFFCGVLVLFMQAGFAMLEVGLNSAKNTINILFKNVMDLSVGIILFFFIGYGLMYPGENFAGGFFGYGGVMSLENAAGGGAYHGAADFLFQAAFAATASTIVSGAVAGRMKFSAYLIYSAILTGIIYPISGMWKWGGGYFGVDGNMFHDFAGSVVVHAVGGFAGLAGAIALGPRLGRFSESGESRPIPGHNVTFAALGVFILWVGWYGFNPGSQLAYGSNGDAAAVAYIAVTTSLSAAAGAIISMVTAWILFKKPDVTMALNGALAGLVGITANCDQVSTTSALIIGAVGGVLVVLAIIGLEKFKIDDPVGAFPVHGVCGVWGGIATGIFGTAGDLSLSVQITATVAMCVWAFVTMFGLFMGLKSFGMLRVSREEEEMGLDLSEHGMRAYGDSLS